MRFVAPSRRSFRKIAKERSHVDWVGNRTYRERFCFYRWGFTGWWSQEWMDKAKGFFGSVTCYDWVAFFCGREEPALFSLSPASSEEEDW